ncbi:MAG: hypothetical protein P8Z00_04835 [Anaerolineales bacterium]
MGRKPSIRYEMRTMFHCTWRLSASVTILARLRALDSSRAYHPFGFEMAIRMRSHRSGAPIESRMEEVESV